MMSPVKDSTFSALRPLYGRMSNDATDLAPVSRRSRTRWPPRLPAPPMTRRCESPIERTCVASKTSASGRRRKDFILGRAEDALRFLRKVAEKGAVLGSSHDFHFHTGQHIRTWHSIYARIILCTLQTQLFHPMFSSGSHLSLSLSLVSAAARPSHTLSHYSQKAHGSRGTSRPQLLPISLKSSRLLGNTRISQLCCALAPPLLTTFS